MKSLIIYCLLTLLLSSVSFCQVASINLDNSADKFVKMRLTISENINGGKRTRIYVLTATKFQIYEKPFLNQSYKEHLYTKHEFESKALLDEIRKLDLQS